MKDEKEEDAKEEVEKKEVEQEYVPEKKEEKKEVDKKDCYFDEECHKLVDWDMVTRVKMGFFSRAKMTEDKAAVQGMHDGLRARLVKAGVPEDRVDYIVDKWMKSATGEKQAPAAAAASDSEVCAKYEGLGELAVSGCAKCAKYYPGKTDQCMGCGKRCARKLCERDNMEECVKSEPFRDCHKECMGTDAAVDHKYAKLMRIKRVFGRMYSMASDFFYSFSLGI
jgi:hypothetical protein